MYCILYLHDGFCVFQQPANKSVARLVEGHHPLLLFGQDLALLHTACPLHKSQPKSGLDSKHVHNEDNSELENAVLPAITLSTAYSKLKVSMDL